MLFADQWKVRPARPTVVNPTTGRPLPVAGDPPPAESVTGELQQEFPRTEQKELGNDVVVDERMLLLDPSILIKLSREPGPGDVAIGPDETVWSIVRVGQVRKRGRRGRDPKYVVVIVRRATDIKEK